jgi:hypothetical protein
MVDVATMHTHRGRGRKTHHHRPATLALISGTTKKGDVLSIARIAGIQGASTSDSAVPPVRWLAGGRGIRVEAVNEPSVLCRATYPSPARPAWKWKPCRPMTWLCSRFDINAGSGGSRGW